MSLKSVLSRGPASFRAPASITVPIAQSVRTLSSSERLLNMNDLRGMPSKTRKRRGRGIGTGLGKQSGWGHQKSRSTPRAFEGGQTPLY